MNRPRRFASRSPLLLSLVAVLSPWPVHASAQTLADGYAASPVTLPAGSGQVLVMDDATIYFTGKDLVLRGAGATRKLLSFGSSVYGSFTIRAGKDAVLFGESSNGGIWLVPTGNAGTPKQLATLKFNYAATLYDSTFAIVSAKTGGFAAKDNDIVAVNLATGALDPIAVVAGDSGPVVADGYGNLYYATAGSTVDIVRFGHLQVLAAFGPGHMTSKDATLVHRGLAAAASMAMDDDHDLFVTDWKNNAVVEISDILSASPRQAVLAAYSGSSVSAASLQFVAGDHRGFVVQEFEPFQPADGGSLVIHETDFSSTSQVRRVVARRPMTSIDTNNPVPKGSTFRIRITSGPAGGTGLVALGLGHSPREVVFQLGFEHPIFWSGALLAPILLTPVSFDSTGATALALFNPGFASPLALATQCHFVAAGRDAAGSSPPLDLLLR